MNDIDGCFDGVVVLELVDFLCVVGDWFYGVEGWWCRGMDDEFRDVMMCVERKCVIGCCILGV